MGDLKTEFCGVSFKNPVIAASGTFGYGRQYAEFYDLSLLGGISVKGMTVNKKMGNAPPRVAETASGMLNSVGLQNSGVKAFIEEKIPFVRQYDTVLIANAAGATLEEYVEICKTLDNSNIDMIELNLSCPNVSHGGMAFGVDEKSLYKVTSAVRRVVKNVPLVVKLSPNVTDITKMAKAAENAGADGLSLINTLSGMAIDINTRRPVLANNIGGLSGPAIKPVALRMVYAVANSVKIPIIGMGGISNGDDAVEFLLAGASLVMVGTAIFNDPMAPIKIIDGIKKYLLRHSFSSVKDIIGKLMLNN